MPECVIVLHGLARTNRSMNKITGYLQNRGYRVFNTSYPSTKFKIERLADTAVRQAIEKCQTDASGQIHFVTHSMGGILVRYFLNRHKIPRIGRIVMLCPPNQGSEIVDKLGQSWLFKAINGPAGNQLGTDSKGILATLSPIEPEIGIIAGNKTLNPFTSLLIPGENDGKVSVYRAKLVGMKDFLVVPHSHTFIMQSPLVLRQVAYFLQYGKFLQ